MKKIIMIIFLICLLPTIAMADSSTVKLSALRINGLAEQDDSVHVDAWCGVFDDPATATGRDQGVMGNVYLSDSVALGVLDSAFMYLDFAGVETDAANLKTILYGVKRLVVYDQVTWNSYSTGNAWQTAGIQGANDRSSGPVSIDTIQPVDTLTEGQYEGYYKMTLSIDSLANYEHFVIRAVQNSAAWKYLRFERDSIYIVLYYSAGGDTAELSLDMSGLDTTSNSARVRCDITTANSGDCDSLRIYCSDGSSIKVVTPSDPLDTTFADLEPDSSYDFWAIGYDNDSSLTAYSDTITITTDVAFTITSVTVIDTGSTSFKLETIFGNEVGNIDSLFTYSDTLIDSVSNFVAGSCLDTVKNHADPCSTIVTGWVASHTVYFIQIGWDGGVADTIGIDSIITDAAGSGCDCSEMETLLDASELVITNKIDEVIDSVHYAESTLIVVEGKVDGIDDNPWNNSLADTSSAGNILYWLKVEFDSLKNAMGSKPDSNTFLSSDSLRKIIGDSLDQITIPLNQYIAESDTSRILSGSWFCKMIFSAGADSDIVTYKDLSGNTYGIKVWTHIGGEENGPPDSIIIVRE